MTATLEFNLPEDASDHALACNASNLAREIDYAATQVRSWQKHGHKFANADEAIEEFGKLLSEAYDIVWRAYEGKI